MERMTVAKLGQLYQSGRMSPGDLSEAIRRSADADPKGTWEWVDELEVSDFEKQCFREEIAKIWFARDPNAMVARLDPGDYHLWPVAGILLDQLASDDPKAAKAVRDHLDELIAATASAYTWSPKPGEQSAALLETLPDGLSRDVLIRKFAQDWLAKDPTAARAWLAKFPREQQNDVLEQFTGNMLSSFGGSSREGRALAMEWIQNEAPPAARARLGPELVETIALVDPAGALAWAQENLSSAPLAEATGKVVSKLFASDPEQARKMVEALPPGNLLHQAAAEVATAWAEKDPLAAATWWMDQMEPGETNPSWGNRTAWNLADAWVKADSDSLRGYMQDPSSRQLPDALVSSAVGKWMEKDAAGTLDWLAKVPENRRGEAVDTAFSELARDNPAKAAAEFEQRSAIATPDAAGSIARIWFRTDQDAAIAWAASLPEGAARGKVLEGLKNQADFEVQLGGVFPEALEKLLP